MGLELGLEISDWAWANRGGLDSEDDVLLGKRVDQLGRLAREEKGLVAVAILVDRNNLRG